MRVLLGAVVCVACVQPADPKGEAASPLLHARKVESPPIDVNRAARDPEELVRAAARRHRDAAARLGSHRFTGNSSAEVTPPGGATAENPADDLGEEAHLDVDAAGNYHALYSNSHEVGREAYFIGGMMWIRERWGKFHHRPPAEDEEAARTADEVYGTLGADLELVSRFVAVRDGGAVTVAGRPARKILISLGSPREVKLLHSGEEAWRDKLVVRSLSGEIALDDATGIVLDGSLTADVRFERGGAEVDLALMANHAVTDIGAPLAVTPPTESDSIDTPGRLADMEDRKALLGGLGSRGAGSAPSPAARAPRPPAVPATAPAVKEIQK